MGDHSSGVLTQPSGAHSAVPSTWRAPTDPLDAARRFFGVCLGHVTERQAEQWLRMHGVPAVAEVCTHRVPGAERFVALSVAVPLSTAPTLPPVRPEFADAAMRAAAAHAAGRAGRAVYFRGGAALAGRSTVEAVTASTAIGRVVVGDGVPVPAASPVGPLHAARPVWRGGVLTLFVVAAADGSYAPCEETAARA